MSKKDKPAGQALSGKSSDRLRRGEIAADPLAERAEADDRPKAKSVKDAAGYGLGRGATRGRSGKGSS